MKPNPAKAFSADPVSFRKVCFIGIIVVGCLALGAVLRSDTLADRFSPRGAEQLCSAGFFLSCMGGASAIWLLNALFFRRVAGARAMRAVCRMNEEAILWPWGLPVLAGLVFVLYWPALDLTFFADDFYILSLISNGPMRALLPVRDIYHYSPVALFLVAIPRWLGMGEPSIYHVLNIALHAVNGCLVYLLARLLFQSRFHAFGSAILFSFYFLSYEPVLWPLVGNNYLWSASFALLSFLSFLRYRECESTGYFWGFLVFYVLCINTNEITVPLIGVCLFHDIGRERGSRIPSSLKHLLSRFSLYFLPAAAVVVLWIIKYFFTKSIVVSPDITLLRVIQRVVSAGCFLLPFNTMTAYWLFSRWGQVPFFSAATAAVILLLAAIIFVKAGWAQRTMLVWCFFFTVPALLLAEPSPRYFYLPAVGWSIFWTGAIRGAAEYIAQWSFPGEAGAASKPRAAFPGLLAAALLGVCIAFQGYRHSASLVDVWREGSVIIQEVTRSTAELISRYPEKDSVIVVDQPVWLQNNDFYGVSLFTMPLSFPLRTLAGVDHPDITSVSLTSSTPFISFPLVTREELDAAAAETDTLVIQYAPQERRMILYTPSLP